jgi:hypothetical protein
MKGSYAPDVRSNLLLPNLGSTSVNFRGLALRASLVITKFSNYFRFEGSKDPIVSAPRPLLRFEYLVA